MVDFCSLKKRLVIELDGGQHQECKVADEEREQFLNKCGYQVIRFWNDDVLKKIDAVLAKIYRELSPTQPPPKITGEEQ